MILHIYAKIKALNWKPDAESVIQLEADLQPSEVQQLAAFGGTTLMVQLLKQQPDMFDEGIIDQQPGLFDQADLPEATGPTCTKCGGDLDELVCVECGQQHRAPSGEVVKPEPVLCGVPAKFRLAAASEGSAVATIDVCEAHLEAADPNRENELDDVPEGATCEWALTTEEIAERQGPLCVCGHPLSSHSIGWTCLDCNCMAFRPAGVLEDTEAETEMEAAEEEASR